MMRLFLSALTLGLFAQEQPAGGLLRHLSIANIKSSGATTIRAMKTDAEGNITRASINGYGIYIK